MLKPIGYFKAFHHDTPLLFQFIYTEFLAAQQEMLSLTKLAGLKADNVSLEVVSSVLTKLCGAAADYKRLFHWNSNDGILTKLKTNCSYFHQNCPGSESSMLHAFVDQAWLLIAECLHRLHEQSSIETPLLLQAAENLLSAGEILKGMIEGFKEDENVIFFILRHQNQLDALYPEPFVRNYFEKIYPEGLLSVSRLLIERYKARGFAHLIPSIEKACLP